MSDLLHAEVGRVHRTPPKLPKIGQTTLSLAYYFQRQESPSILNVTPGSPITGITFTGLPANASQVFAQKGDIHLAQLKWALGNGQECPLSIRVQLLEQDRPDTEARLAGAVWH